MAELVGGGSVINGNTFLLLQDSQCVSDSPAPNPSSTDEGMFPELVFQLFWTFFNLSLCFLAALLYTGDQQVLLAGSHHKISVTIVVALIVTIWVLTISTLVLFWATGIKEINDEMQYLAPPVAENPEDPENPENYEEGKDVEIV